MDPNMEPRVEWDQQVKRKVQISFVGTIDDNTVFTYYWKKIVKPNDEIILAHVLKHTIKDEELQAVQEKLLNSVGVAPFIEECKRRTMNYQSIFQRGKPGEVICQLANEHKPHLVVIGSRGLNKIQRTLYSSVSGYVLHHTQSPVLIIPYKSGLPKSV